MTPPETNPNAQNAVGYKTVRIEDQDIFYREAGPSSAPVILLLHGLPTSSKMYHNLIPRLVTAVGFPLTFSPRYAKNLRMRSAISSPCVSNAKCPVSNMCISRFLRSLL
jgi:hypothetical protein